MKSWTEFHIAVIYYIALFIALLAGVVTVFYLRTIKFTLKKISAKSEKFWSRSFSTTTVLAGLLGALMVTYRDCDGKYDYLINSPKTTINVGLEQINYSFVFLTITLLLWLVIFLVLLLTKKKIAKTE